MRAVFSSHGMSVWGIAASPSSISLAACSRCRRRKRGGQSPPSSIPARSTTSWSCDELKRLGHHFKTCSDTEVVLRGYLQWGDEVVERLNGMFAFAIWDVGTEELFLARDRMGVKPLFYYPTVGGVLFGSEPKAILAHPSVRPRVDKDGFRELLVLAKNPEVTIYAGMCEVRPGEVVHVNRNGITKRRYWKLTAREHEDDLPRTIRTVTELLEDIVQRQI